MSTKLQQSKLFLGEAARLVARVCEHIDDNYDEKLPQDLIDAFESSTQELAAGVDRRIAVNAQFESTIEALKNRESWAIAVRKRLEKEHESFVQRTREIVEQNPDVVFKSGNFGTVLKIQKNGGRQAIKYHLVTGNRSVSKVIDDQTIEMFDIDDKYLEYVSCIKINTDAVFADLSAGKQIGWAEFLPQGTRLAGLTIPKPKKEIK